VYLLKVIIWVLLSEKYCTNMDPILNCWGPIAWNWRRQTTLLVDKINLFGYTGSACAHLVRPYSRQLDHLLMRAVQHKMPPLFCTARATSSFGISSFPCHINYVVTGDDTPPHSCRQVRERILELLGWILLDRSWRTAGLARPHSLGCFPWG
jgi:hypothetical protein